jgi:hypothetical protein
MSSILDFYSGKGADTEGRSLADILAWSDDALEEVHDFIQWLFPLPEPSQFNPDAPLLAQEDIAAFHAEPALQANVRKSFARILTFLGLAASDGKVVPGANFSARAADVWAAPNHNWLRITRILRSLTLLGLVDEARSLFGWLEATYTSRKFPIPADTFRYWSAAVGS